MMKARILTNEFEKAWQRSIFLNLNFKVQDNQFLRFYIIFNAHPYYAFGFMAVGYKYSKQ